MGQAADDLLDKEDEEARRKRISEGLAKVFKERRESGQFDNTEPAKRHKLPPSIIGVRG